MQSVHWSRLDQQRIDRQQTSMYELAHNLTVFPMSDFLIPLEKPSQQYNLQADNCYDWLLHVFIISCKSCIPLENFCPKPWPVPPWSSSIKQSASLNTYCHRKTSYLFFTFKSVNLFSTGWANNRHRPIFTYVKAILLRFILTSVKILSEKACEFWKTRYSEICWALRFNHRDT